jgi:hypothetical protein
LLVERERNARLREVVADRDLPAERIAPAGDAQRVEIVGISLTSTGTLSAPS